MFSRAAQIKYWIFAVPRSSDCSERNLKSLVCLVLLFRKVPDLRIIFSSKSLQARPRAKIRLQYHPRCYARAIERFHGSFFLQPSHTCVRQASRTRMRLMQSTPVLTRQPRRFLLACISTALSITAKMESRHLSRTSHVQSNTWFISRIPRLAWFP